ncbi:hypothetical protein C8A01DRAFT_40184 [Parachaetomium inaequale]|uniref:Uncharacterized protein n=1 Tax=Parachaetomium inaequale TaxID=2588326 RepID=A0AAN6P7W6_9PEZI|nr:hypothetical protein C8A01DRAFT_40184 [Parachaetomium inaequale]
MARTKKPARSGATSPKTKPSPSDHDAREPPAIKKAKAALPSDPSPLVPAASQPATQPTASGPNAIFLVQPQDMVYISEKLRPFVVMASVPADTVDKSLPPYRATVAIFYDNSDIEVLDPSPVVEHTNHWIQSAARSPSQDGTTRIHFVFDNVKVDYLGEYTMAVSIFRPGDDLEGPAYLTTPWSIMTRVAALSQRIQPTPPSQFDRLVYTELGLHLDSDHGRRRDN